MRTPFILIGICILLFALQQIIPGFTESLLLISSHALSEPWRFVTSIFVHADLLHLGYNMLALFFFGLVLESVAGARIFLVIFFLAGIDASFASLFFYERSLGASGAVYGIIGALAALRPRLTAFALGVPMPMIAVAAAYLLLDILGVFYPTNVANIAHITGLFIGAAAGLLLRRKFPEPRGRKPPRVASEKEMDEWEDRWMGK